MKELSLSSLLKKLPKRLNCEVINEDDGLIFYIPSFFSVTEADEMMALLSEEIDWHQGEIKLYGRLIKIPRLQAWIAEGELSYTYSGVKLQPTPWFGAMQVIRQRIEDLCAYSFNSALMNYYRDQKDSVSWHSDDEPELGKNPVIALLSFGAVRRLDFQHKQDAQRDKIKLDLESGSLLLMGGSLQHHWKHQLPKMTKESMPRISMTLRNIMDN